MAYFLVANPSVAMTYANVQLINDGGDPYYFSDYRRDNQRKSDTSILDLPCETSCLQTFSDNFVNACFLLRKSVCKKVGDYDAGKLGYEDYDYWLRVSDHGLIAHLDSDEPLYQYRLHDNTLTAQLKVEQLQNDQRRILGRRKVATAVKAEVKLPTILRRARDANFGAVALKEGENFAAVVIARNWTPQEESFLISELAKLEVLHREWRFVIVNIDGVKIGNELSSKFEGSSSFTYLNFSAEPNDAEVFASGVPNKWASLMYAISGSNALVDIVDESIEHSVRAVENLLGIGALTRRNVYSPALNENAPEALKTAPHAYFGGPSLLAEVILKRPAIGSVEQWLRQIA